MTEQNSAFRKAQNVAQGALETSVHRVQSAHIAAATDLVAVEEPLEIRLVLPANRTSDLFHKPGKTRHVIFWHAMSFSRRRESMRALRSDFCLRGNDEPEIDL